MSKAGQLFILLIVIIAVIFFLKEAKSEEKGESGMCEIQCINDKNIEFGYKVVRKVGWRFYSPYVLCHLQKNKIITAKNYSRLQIKKGIYKEAEYRNHDFSENIAHFFFYETINDALNFAGKFRRVRIVEKTKTYGVENSLAIVKVEPHDIVYKAKKKFYEDSPALASRKIKIIEEVPMEILLKEDTRNNVGGLS